MEKAESNIPKILLAVLTAALALGSTLVIKTFIESPDKDLASLQMKQEELIGQMRPETKRTADDLAGFFSRSGELAKWADRHQGDQRAHVNRMEIERLYIQLWSEACGRVRAATRSGGDHADSKALGEAKRLLLIKPNPPVSDRCPPEGALVATDAPQESVPAPSSSKPSVHDVSILLYNGAAEPLLFVDSRAADAPEYSSGIATLHLSAGSHQIRAEYPNRTCSATVRVPTQGPVTANCLLK